jgi:hypothetical protein
LTHGIFANARSTAEQIPNTAFVSLPGLDHPQALFRAADLIVPHALKFLSEQTGTRPL